MSKTPDDYMREMMEMYKSRTETKPEPVYTPKPEPAPEPKPAPIPEPTPEPIPTPIPDPEPTPEPVPIPAPEPITVIQAENVLPENMDDLTAEPSPNTSYGYIQATARAASQAQPLAGVSVYISRGDDLLYTLQTNESGLTDKVRLPAPPIAKNREEAKVQPFSIYNVSAYLDGYAQLRSESVPVFAGVTSIQPFNMIPLPTGTESETVTNQNTEPEF